MLPRNRTHNSRAFTVLALLLAVAVGGCRADTDSGGSYPAASRADCLPAVALTDQSGRKLSLASLKGKPVLVDFIYTSCTGPCPRLTSNMAAVAQQLGESLGTKVTLLTVTLDPEHDTPAQLRSYAKQQSADRPGWYFVTGTPDQIEQVLGAFGLRREREADGSVTHMVEAYLLGPDGRQIRQYNGIAVKPATVIADIDVALGRG